METKDQGLSIRAEGEAAQAFAAAGPLVLEIPFEAPYQAENAMLAVKTAVVLGQRERGFRLTEAQITEGIRTARWAGRMERAGENLYLDGAHNPGGIKAFIQAAASMAAGRKKRRICYLAPYRTRITGLWPGCSVRGFPGRGSVWYI